jgi:uroporphyrinogen-III decarboxylase
LITRRTKVNSTKEKLYYERNQRITDAIALRKPDRVPIGGSFGFFTATYSGISAKDLMYDPKKAYDATWKIIRDFQPDVVHGPYDRLLGPMLDILNCTEARWPGKNLPDHLPFQYLEQEYMRAEEYDHLVSDPSDFIVRRLWPRIFGSLKGLEKLPALHNMYSYSQSILTAFGSPEITEALEALLALSRESAKVVPLIRNFVQEAKEEGFPMENGGVTQAPFDILADFFRSTKSLMLDMYRKPATVIKACEALLPFQIDRAVTGAKASGNPRIFIPLHKGTDSAMSRQQYLKFYWPTLKELMVALIAEGLNPCPFFEGTYESRLDIIKDIPEGKACYRFESTDMVTARKILGEGIAIRGGVPISLLVAGTPDEVKEHCRKLMDNVAKDGGFIMDTSSGLDNARPENVRALFEATREYKG